MVILKHWQSGYKKGLTGRGINTESLALASSLRNYVFDIHYSVSFFSPTPDLCLLAPRCLLFSGRMIAKIHPHEPEFAGHSLIDDKLSRASATRLTVWKKSLVFSCNGCTVFDSSGNLVFRVDNYPSDPKDKVLLMDAAGMALLTMRRKRLSLQNEWQGFPGEFRDAQPLFVLKRAPSLLISRKSLAEVYMCSSAKRKKKKKPHSDYRVEGCYAKRSFTLLNSFNEVVAEVKPKQVRSDIRLGGDVFDLTVRPGYDQAFVMGLIIVLDQIMPSD